MFIHSSIDGPSGCFYLLTVVNNAAVNICVQVFRGHVFSLGCTPGSEVARSNGLYPEELPVAAPPDMPNVPTSSGRTFQFLPLFLNTSCCPSFFVTAVCWVKWYLTGVPSCTPIPFVTALSHSLRIPVFPSPTTGLAVIHLLLHKGQTLIQSSACRPSGMRRNGDERWASWPVPPRKRVCKRSLGTCLQEFLQELRPSSMHLHKVGFHLFLHATALDSRHTINNCQMGE